MKNRIILLVYKTLITILAFGGWFYLFINNWKIGLAIFVVIWGNNVKDLEV